MWNSEDGWRTSWQDGGNPGAADPGYDPASVVINEVLTHTDSPQGDWIELKNTTTDQTINITGWYLSDDPATLQKWRIATPTLLGPGECVVFTQADDFGATFGLSEFGDEVCLTAAEGVWLRGYRANEDFGAADRDITFGRHIKSTGRKDFVALTSPTYEGVNAPPLIPDVVISEVMYHPAIGGHEFIELANRTGAPFPLYDAEPTPNPWQFTDGVVYTFPADASIPGHGYALVVGIDPATFRATYGIDASVPIYGPWTGALQNAGERVELSRPGEPEWVAPPPGELPGYVPYIVAEKVTYNDLPAWPTDPDGLGPSLERILPGDYGNDAANWASSASAGGTPGAANAGVLPRVVSVALNPGPGRAARSVGEIDPSGLGVETVVVTFSKDVTFAPEDVVAEKVTFDALGNQTSAVAVAPAGVYGSGTDEMIITFADSWQQMVDTWVRITLADTIINASAQGLDGEPAADSSGLGYIHESGADLPSGDGAAGGDAVFYVGSLRADMRGFGPIAIEPNGTVDSWDITGFTQKYLAGDLDTDFRGFGPIAEEPNGAVDSWDINGFTSRYTAALAAGTHLNDLPTSGGQGMATGTPAPLPPETALLESQRLDGQETRNVPGPTSSGLLSMKIGERASMDEFRSSLTVEEEPWAATAPPPTTAEPVEASVAPALAPNGGMVDLLALSALDVRL
jgi:hypothetical protein